MISAKQSAQQVQSLCTKGTIYFTGLDTPVPLQRCTKPDQLPSPALRNQDFLRRGKQITPNWQDFRTEQSSKFSAKPLPTAAPDAPFTPKLASKFKTSLGRRERGKQKKRGKRKNIKSTLLTTSSVNITSSSSTGGMGSAGSMVCRAKLLSLRSRYVISGWSLLRKQQKMKEIPRPLLFLGAMAKILCVPPFWALDPEGKRREEARAAVLQCCAPVLPRGGGIKATHALGAEGKTGDGLSAKYFCSHLTFMVLATLMTM